MAESTTTPEDRDVRTQTTDDDALIRTARARFTRSEEAEAELRREFGIDQEYRAGMQWPDDVRNDRESFGQRRPCHVVNLLPGAIAQVTNEQRAHRPSLRVSPAGGDATVEVAQICDGLLRHIQRDSRAPIAYDVASAEAAGPGRGWFRVITEYESPRSFAQKLTILSIPNAMSVYPQPNLREPDYSDMQWCFVVEDVAHDEFLARYPGMEPQAFDAWASAGGDPWITRDTVRVADYYYRELEPTTLVLLSDGTVVDLEGAGVKALPPLLPPGVTIVDQRTAQLPKVYWCKINGQQVLERTAWPGSWIPVVPVLGDMFYVNGRVRISGIIRDARDPQTMINYWESARTEAIALAPRAPWIGAEGQFEGHEQEWEHANRRNYAYLEYKIMDVRGAPVGPPQRNVQEPAIQALNYACESAKNNFQATTRIYDASYGAPGNERSGRAIQARDANADMSNSHYNDNLGRSLHHLGRLLLELLPRIYDEPGRVQQIVHEDGTEKLVTLNQPYTDDETGIEQFYNLGAGHYAVEVTTGPSYATRRQEGFAGLTELAKADPKIMQVADDLVIAQSDIVGAKDIAKRLKKTIPPQLLDDEQGADKDTQLAQATGQAQRFQQEAQALDAHAQELTGQAQQLAQENQALKAQAQSKAEELALKRAELQLKAQADQARLALEQATAGQDAQQAQAQLALDQLKCQLDAEKLALERVKVQQALHQQAREQQVQDAQQDAQTVTLDTVAGLQAQLVALTATVQQSLQVLLQDAADRQAPKTLTMQRDAHGTLVGQVHDPAGQVVRRLALARTADGYTGEVG
jgi:hypothetical protein